MALIPGTWRKSVAKYAARWALGLALTLAGAAQVVGLLDSALVERLDLMAADLRMRLEPARLDRRVVIVDIDEKSLNAVGRFPWSRDVQARLVTQLTGRYQAATVGFDISFPEPDTSSGYAVLERLAQGELDGVAEFKERLAALKPALDYDGLFAAAMQGRPVVLGYSVSAQQQKGVLPAPAFTVAGLNGRALTALSPRGYEANIAQLQQAARGAGIFTALTDADGVLRSSTLLQRIGDAYYPSLSLATAAVYLKARAIAPHFTRNADSMSAADLDNGGLEKILLFTPAGQVGIPVGEALTTIVQFRGAGGPRGGAFRYVSAADVLSGAAPAAALRGAIALVGSTAPGINDIRATPVNPEYPGVEVHANLIKSILDGRFKSRPYYAPALELLQVLGLGLLLSLALAALSPLASIGLALGALGAAAGFNYYLYSEQDAVINIAVVALLVMGLFVLHLGWGYCFEFRKGRALVSRFGEYVAPELVAEMADDPERYNMEGESRELSVLFADVRGFTTIAEGLTPTALREYINLYLTAMSEDIRDSHHGTLDKYIGDAVMAFWGAPVAFADHAGRAVATALLMQASARRLNRDFAARGWPTLAIGIGVNSGLMHVGDMGSRIRRAYTVMGDAVNLGARLEGITKVYGVGIAVGAATRAAAPEFAYRELDLVRVKGKSEPVAIFEPLGLAAQLGEALSGQLERWHRALALVRAQQWDRAALIVDELAREDAGAALYRLYAARITRYRANPPGYDWDGVTTFDSK
ncbi:CHASE2 domain-containing protein [Janthinobacterium fluminis]|uniref:Adenylate/guanylate cyclase domain-containing protein n=1 Tax=Janthinobacterium fluminis TaxID=2987524 RepID=A0ABT5K4S2_9BURK|nr:adenylate/guanylate cyclase domain-containing protein [Janthinobacterium fluminis]MDC8759101.1 adenylate/guanylate cyclase domain-containing protein [Janthinobacterium fluminis]